MQASFIAKIYARILTGANATTQVSPSPTEMQVITPWDCDRQLPDFEAR